MIALLQWNMQWTGWSVAIAAAVVGVLVIMEYAGSRCRPSVAIGLACLRAAGLVIVGIAAFQPSVVSETPSSGLRRVIIMVDDSRSMATVDTGRSVAELAQFAELTGQIPADLRRHPTGAVLAQLKSVDAALVKTGEAETELAKAKNAGVVSEQLSRNVQARAGEALALLSGVKDLALEDDSTEFAVDRLEKAEQSLADPVDSTKARKSIASLMTELHDAEAEDDAGLERSNEELADAVESLRHSSRLDFAIATASRLVDDLRPLANVTLQKMQTPVPADSLRTIRANGQTTPLLQSLRQTIERGNPQEIDAIMLLTDGRSTEGRTSISPVVSAAGVPVFPVMVAASNRVPDVRVVSVEAPAAAMCGQTVPVIVRLRSSNAEGKTARITLTDGITILNVSQTLRAIDDAVVFSFPMGQGSKVDLRARVDPLPDEESIENNVYSAHVELDDRKVTVASWLGAGNLGTEGLRKALQGAPWITVKHQPTVAEEIEAADVFIVAGDASVPAAHADLIQRAVTAGKSVYFVAGTPESLNALRSQTGFAPLLPTGSDSSASWFAEESTAQGVQVVPTPFASVLPMVSLDDLPESAMRQWLARPRLGRLVNPGTLRRDALTLMVDRSTQTPILVEATAGRGRSLLLTTDESWRWRSDMGVQTFDRFWLYAINHLLESKPDVASNGLELSVEPKVVDVGRPVDVRCRVPIGASADVQLLLKDERGLTPQAVYERIPESGRWLARFSPNRSGPAELILRSGANEVAVAIRVLPLADPELADVSPDPALLKRIAGATGGEVITLDQVGQVAQRLRDRAGSRVEVSVFEAWCSPYLFGAVLGCLGLEWVIRKQKGLI